MPVEPSEVVRHRLSGLREQRRAQLVSQEHLSARVRETVAEAIDAGVPVAEIARLLDMDRSSLYRTYINDTAAA